MLSDDFFDVLLYPNAVFTITKVSGYNSADSSVIEGANYKITGNFSMLGKVKSISFPANITTTGDAITTKAVFSIDRTKWGMDSYSNPNGGVYILPEVEIRPDIYAENKIN